MSCSTCKHARSEPNPNDVSRPVTYCQRKPPTPFMLLQNNGAGQLVPSGFISSFPPIMGDPNQVECGEYAQALAMA